MKKILFALVLLFAPYVSHAGNAPASNVSNYTESAAYDKVVGSMCNRFAYNMKEKLDSRKWTDEQLANLAYPAGNIEVFCWITPSRPLIQSLNERIEAAWVKIHEPGLKAELSPDEYSEYQQLKRFITEEDAKLDGKPDPYIPDLVDGK